MARLPAPPPPRTETARARIRAALSDGTPRTLRELSAEVHLSERDLPDHLEHLARSLRREGRRLVLERPTCVHCGFSFPGRQRFTRPGRCPSCRSTQIAPPQVRIAR